MKVFLRKILFFFSLLLLVIVVTVGITFSLSFHNASNLELNPEIEILICGDSHTKTALNDSLIPNSLNIAHSSEHYFYTYYVLKILLRNNPQIKTIVLGLSFHNLSGSYDDYIYDQSKTQYMYPRYFTTLDAASMMHLLENNSAGLVADFRNIYHGIYRHIGAREPRDFSFIGWFYKSRRNNLNDSTVQYALKEHFYRSDGLLAEESFVQIAYLEKIMALCDDLSVELILLNCPLSPEYSKGIPAMYLDLYNDLKSGDSQHIWDEHNFQVPDSCWGDGDHLNLSGSVIFSEYFINARDSIMNKP